MKTKTFLFCISLLIAVVSFAQEKIDPKVLESLPQNLELEDELQKYQVTTIHYNSDMFGNFFNKFRVRGEYTRGLDNGKVKWNNVTVAMSMQRNADFSSGTKLRYMEDYSYLPSPDMLNPEKFETFEEHSAYAKNLIWDMLGIEGFAWAYFDVLELNKPYNATDFNGKMDLAGQGFFENKDVVLTWTGISKFNDELCATIEYRTMNNPLEYKEESMSMKGRSHYWGTIWVSIEDKQVEHANVFEDVMMELQLSGQSGTQLMNATREIVFKKEI